MSPERSQYTIPHPDTGEIVSLDARFMHPEVAHRWVDAYGEVAVNWLQELPDIVSDYAKEHTFSIQEYLQGGSVAAVYGGVIPKTGEEIVVKVQPPWQANLQRESLALKTWNGTCAPLLLGESSDSRMLFMERLRPGIPASSLGLVGIAKLIRQYSEPVQEVLPAKFLEYGIYFKPYDKDDPNVLPVQSWALNTRFTRSKEDRHGFDLHQTRQVAWVQAINYAQGLLFNEGISPGIVHGDLLRKNVIFRGSQPVVIDPSPSVGDIAVDAAQWVLGEICDIDTSCDEVSRHLSVDPERTRTWIALLALGEVGLASRKRADHVLAYLNKKVEQDNRRSILDYIAHCVDGPHFFADAYYSEEDIARKQRYMSLGSSPFETVYYHSPRTWRI